MVVGVAVVGEGVEEGVGGGVVGLGGGAEEAGEGGVEDEGFEVGVVLGELVEVPGCVDFGFEDGVELVGGEGGEGGVVEGAGGVDDGGEGCSVGMVSRSAARASRLAASQATMVVWVPNWCSSSWSSAAPGVLGPWRLVRRRCWAPWWVARWVARWLPRVPVPPVIRMVPSLQSGGVVVGSGVARARRGMRNWLLRRASCGSSRARAVARAVGRAVVWSVSMRWMRSGCSVWAVRIRPQMAAWVRSVTSSSGLMAMAWWVTMVRRVAANRSSASQVCSV
ncbi:hypothetical protein MOV08_43680 [Streptomyces yunnanensis]|uniref:Uncharacterized protein n=1 Tax=Streptomyces yunnanensis TaxID=156453 RepID=A0ABY8AKK3_9ACTN|nr:hypothetical protein [Streptomyces yunnanensis]WEB45508.1 hypothetical protein MOV08_43680 [Streptomyces yunnanensis]